MGMKCGRRGALLALSVLLALSAGPAWAEDAAANAVDPDASLPPWLRNTNNAADEPALDAIGKGDNATVVKAVEEKIDSNKEARVALTNLVIYPDTRAGQRQQIGIKNMGANAIDLAGWRLTNKEGNDTGYVFGENPKCRHMKTVLPSKGTAEYLTAQSAKHMACTLNFTISRGETLKLLDSEGMLKANLKLDFSGTGEYKLSPEGTNYWYIPNSKDKTLMETLDKLGHFKHFTAMLRHFQYDRALAGLGRKRWQSCGAVAYYPYYACTTEYDPEYDIYYRNAPFTVLAPTDAAIDKMLQEVGGSYAPKLTLEEFMALDEGNMAKQLLQYHVIKGHELTSTYKQPNSTLAYSHLPTNRNNSEIVSFSDTFGRLFIHEDCVESHTQDEFGCKMQVEWDKCEEDWMNDEGLFSKRQLGYCEVQCGKCRCDDPETCRDVPLKDIKAKNGVLHVLDHVLDVPDVFPIYEPPPPEPEPEPQPAEILNQFPSYGDVGLTRDAEDADRTIEDLIELYLASRRARRDRESSESARGSRSLVLDGLG
mmetsp:Transcript_36625/g.79329  ORF Transcript_36625/g.79329 Transcript_36625/m.79329 type:complete len:538 (-) Transcript_36625:143-1756(-)